MALTSTLLGLGAQAPEFSLPDTVGGTTVSLQDFDGPLLVMFISNHCPYVKHVRSQLAAIGRDYQPRGLGVVAVGANDADNYPDDSPENMKLEAEAQGYTFPYLHDADQSVAAAYTAVCTPDIFLFDSGRKLVYRGRLDASRPGSDVPVTGEDLRAAIDAVLTGGVPSSDQVPSMGCSIKWKPGNEPGYVVKS